MLQVTRLTSVSSGSQVSNPDDLLQNLYSFIQPIFLAHLPLCSAFMKLAFSLTGKDNQIIKIHSMIDGDGEKQGHGERGLGYLVSLHKGKPNYNTMDSFYVFIKSKAT